MYTLIFDNGEYLDIPAKNLEQAITRVRTMFTIGFLLFNDAEIISPNGENYSFTMNEHCFKEKDKDYSE